MERNNDEPVIFWKDLIFAALRRWKVALLFGLVLAMLLGVYKATTDRQRADDNPLYAEQMKQYEDNRKYLENIIARQQKDVDNQLAYLEKSVFMRLDPFNHYRVNFTISVDTHYQINPENALQAPDTTPYIVDAYHIGLTSSESVKTLAELVGIEAHYLSEVYIVDIPEESNQLTLSILFPTEEGANTLLAQLLLEYETVHQQLNQDLQVHDCVILEQSVSRSADTKVAEAQSAALNVLQELRTALSKSNESLSSLTRPSVTVFSYKTAVIFAIAGFIGGIALVTACAWINLIASQKVYSTRALQARTRVKILGCVCPRVPRNPIDRFLGRLEGRDMDSTEDRTTVLTKEVSHRCQGISHLLITGDPDPETFLFLTDALAQTMPGVKISSHGSILRNSDAIDALDACDKVLMIEKCGVSCYEHVAAQRAKIADYNKELLGCILIDG